MYNFSQNSDDKLDPLISLKELLNVGWPFNIDEQQLSLIFEDDTHVWSHKSCVLWSDGVYKDDKNHNLLNIDKSFCKGLTQVIKI